MTFVRTTPLISLFTPVTDMVPELDVPVSLCWAGSDTSPPKFDYGPFARVAAGDGWRWIKIDCDDLSIPDSPTHWMSHMTRFSIEPVMEFSIGLVGKPNCFPACAT